MGDNASFTVKFGAALIITGTCVGAGMLVIPLITAAIGFLLASVLLIAISLVMIITAYLIIEVNLAMPDGTNFSIMAKKTLGIPGQVISWLSFLLLLYALAAAYTAQGSSLLSLMASQIGVNIPLWANSLIFILILGLFVYTGTFAVDRLNKALISVKFFTFLSLAAMISPNVTSERILTEPVNSNLIWVTLPLLITSFGYHTVLPSMRSYLKSNKKDLHNAIIWGGLLIPLLVYLIWEAITLGTIPVYGKYGFQYISTHGNDVAALIKVYRNFYELPLVSTLATIFTNIAITTSFLGVTLGLFNFNQDTYRLKRNHHFFKIIAFILTFAPPFIFSVYYPDGFIMALGYASIFVAVLLISLPAMMAWKIRSRNGQNTLFSNIYLSIIVLIGIMMIVLQFATQFKMLPVFG